MANLKLVKSATALVLGASVLTSAVAVSGTDASAKTTYKVTKKGTLVNAKTNKAVKGYKSYKGKLYKNGKKLTGTYKSVFYKSGVKFTGTYNKKYYVKGKLFTGKTSKNVYYKKGVKFTGVTSYGYTYKDGKRVEGEYKGKVYKNGKLVTGLYKDVLYTKGEKETGLDLYQDKLYKDGVLNVGLALHEGKLYKDADLNKGLVKHEDKWYNDAEIADGTYDDNGVERAIENGVEVGAKVKSVEAINGKQIKLTFNKTVGSSATDVANYTIKPAATTVKTISSTSTDADYASAVLSEDKKSVTITFKNALNSATWGLVDGDVFNFNYADVKTANSSETLKGTEVVKYSDKVAPEFVSAKASAKTATSDVTLTFSEPVDTTQALVSINGTYASFSAGSTPNEVVATFTGLDLEAGKSYDMTILNVKDAAGNLIADNNKKVAVKVDADATAPAVTDVKAVSDSKVEITFDKKINLASAKTANAIKFVNGNLASLGTVDSANITASKDGKTLTVPFSAVSFTKGTVTGNLVLTDAITDASGNKLPATSKSLTLTQDVAAPTVVSAKYVNKTTYGDQIGLTNGAIVVKFSEDVAPSAAASGYTVVDNKGNVVATAFGTPVVNGDDESELILPLNAAIDTSLTSYKVVLPVSAVTDLALTPNASKSVNINVDITAGGVVSGNDTTAPTATVTATAATTSTTGTKFDVVFNEAVNTDTVTDVNNYRLNGLPLADGTYVTYNAGTKTATINVPAGSIAKSAANYTLNISGVKDLAGNTINASSAVYNSLTLVDDVAPELTAAVLNTAGSVTLSFSEALAAAPASTDFEVYVDGTKLPTTDYTVTPGNGTDAGKYILTVTGKDLTKSTTSSVTVQVKSATATDTSSIANVLADSKVITVK